MGRIATLTVDGSEMDSCVVEPDSEPVAGILVCMHGPGVDEFVRDICKRLAGEGYLAIAPNLYHRQRELLPEPWTRMDDSESIADMRAAIEFLISEGVPAVGVVGFCMGGRLAYLQLANDDRLRTGVIFHGGNIRQPRGSMPSPFDQSAGIGASILGIFGEDDTNPSPADRDILASRLDNLDVTYHFETYAGAGHAFLNFTRPSMFRAVQAEHAWNLCVTWLDKVMKADT